MPHLCTRVFLKNSWTSTTLETAPASFKPGYGAVQQCFLLWSIASTTVMCSWICQCCRLHLNNKQLIFALGRAKYGWSAEHAMWHNHELMVLFPFEHFLETVFFRLAATALQQSWSGFFFFFVKLCSYTCCQSIGFPYCLLVCAEN